MKFYLIYKKLNTKSLLIKLVEESEEPELNAEEESEDEIYTGKKIFPLHSNPEVRSLLEDEKDGSLILQPDFQRYSVWDIKKASRLIESALLNIPIPTIYTAEEKDGKKVVIDGQQRLSSFFFFINGKFGDTEFKLNGMKVLTDIENKSFKELDKEMQWKIRKYPLHEIMFKKESDSELRYEIFERLNSGSVQLKHQEIRNCTFRGPYNELLKDLAKDKEFMKLLGLKKPHSRMSDIELVLRFASFFHRNYLNYESPMKAFLSKEMSTYQNISMEDARNLKEGFKKAVSLISSMFETNAFKRFNIGDKSDKNGKWGTKFNHSLFDVTMCLFSVKDKNAVMRNLDKIKESIIVLMTENKDFIRSIEISTSRKQAVVTRFNLLNQEIDEILGYEPREPRLFSKSLKEELYNINKTCKICGNEIAYIDDAHVDHIEQYWRGGKTIPTNARLVHRFCNCTRPRDQ